jgi:hypothetical protein
LEDGNVKEFLQKIDKTIKDNPVLDSFFKDKKDYIQYVAEEMTKLEQGPETSLGDKNLVSKAIKVSLHQQVIYCGKSLLDQVELTSSRFLIPV